jgi:hypothetical protein
MPFGGLSPFPLRLGAQSNTSISPENWLRLCDDVVQQRHPLAVLLITEPVENYGPCTVTGLFMGGTDPSAITAQLDEMATDNSYLITVNMGAGYVDSTSGKFRPWAVKFASAKQVGHLISEDVDVYDNSDIEFSYVDVRTGARTHTLVVWGETEPRFSGDYGAEPTKEAAKEAGAVPYAWVWLQEMQAIRGDAFSTTPGSYTQMENIAAARMFAYVQNLAERNAASQIPMQADQAIGRWASLLNIGTTDDRDWQVRRKCAAKFTLTTTGASEQSLEAAASLLFGSNFSEIAWDLGSIDSPPPNTLWPGDLEHIGPAVLDIGIGYAWTSSRYHFDVRLTSTNDTEMARLVGIGRRDFDEILIDVMPPVVTWSYQFNHTDDGFALSVDKLDRDTL